MSNEDDKLMLPKAQECNLLRAPGKFASNLILSSNASTNTEKSQKSMTILEFLQKSANSVLQYDSKKMSKKADILCQTTLSLNSSSSISGAEMPSFTLG